MGLERYKKKRDFTKTPEPAGKRAKRGTTLSFIVQKHAASRLHYDFRLELDGVLKSWAVPKGPCLDPSQKRLAVEVEDHPLEYAGFEGIIPAGQYGGGTVIVWDRGTWTPEEEPHRGLSQGALKFTLDGEKLSGSWALVRIHGRDGKDDRNWLLIKHGDDAARPLAKFDVTVDEPDSVISGRGLEAVAKAKVRTWNSDRGSFDARNGSAGAKPATSSRSHDHAKRASASSRKTSSSTSRSLARRLTSRAGPSSARATTTRGAAARTKSEIAAARVIEPQRSPRSRAKRAQGARTKRARGASIDTASIEGAKRAPLPRMVEPELATLVRTTPRGDEWIHETKFDGYRALCRVSGGRAQWITRADNDWTPKFASLSPAVEALPVNEALFDGEIVVLRKDGTTSFQDLQNSLRGGARNLTYFAFDLLHLDGFDLRAAPLAARKTALRALLEHNTDENLLRFSEHIEGHGEKILDAACRRGLEGIVSKLRDDPYRSGRGHGWVKAKCSREQELVIGGFTRPEGSRRHFGALLLGYFEKKKLRYAGRVGTGFDDNALAAIGAKLRAIEIAKPAFADPPRGADARGVRWVRPSLVGAVRFTAWTSDGMLRHPSFQGLREDKPAREVVREEAVPLARAIDAPSSHGARESARDGAPSRARRARTSERVARIGASKSAAVARSNSRKTESVARSDARKTESVARSRASQRSGVVRSDARESNSVARSRASKPTGVARSDGTRRARVRRAQASDSGNSTVAGIAISHPDRVLYADMDVTKIDLARYYESVGEQILPHVADRPLNLLRCPAGPGKPCFFQRHGHDTFPDVVKTADVGRSETCLYVDSIAGVVALVQMGVLELHPWGAKVDRPELPDRMFFDLDPDPSVPWSRVVETAKLVRAMLAELELESFVKTTGGKGLHVIVPLARRAPWDEVKSFSQGIAQALERAAPDLYIATMSKARRKNRIFIDYLRNARTASAVAAYSTRARPGATVSTPIAWSELDRVSNDDFDVRTVPERLRRSKRDPWPGFLSTKQKISGAALRSLMRAH